MRDQTERGGAIGNRFGLTIPAQGPPGTGKTTSIHCVAHELLGEHYKEAVLELNASDDRCRRGCLKVQSWGVPLPLDPTPHTPHTSCYHNNLPHHRGIDVVRHKIKNFAQQKVTLPPGRHKIVILDEADSMTSGAQQALRRTMEVHSDTTRFALACNTSSKIIEPIQSRCAVVRYGRLGEAEVLGRLVAVATAEGVSFDEAGMAAIVFVADGDMRAALNALQATARGPGVVTQDNVFKVCDQPHPALLREIVSACLKADIELAYRKMQARRGVDDRLARWTD